MKRKVLSTIILFSLLLVITSFTLKNTYALNNDINNRDTFKWKIETSGMNISLTPTESTIIKQTIEVTVIAKTSSNIQLYVELKKEAKTFSISILDYFDDVFEDKNFYLLGILILPTNSSYYDPLDDYFDGEGFQVIRIGGKIILRFNDYTLDYTKDGVLKSYSYNSESGSVTANLVSNIGIVIPVAIIGAISGIVAIYFVVRISTRFLRKTKTKIRKKEVKWQLSEPKETIKTLRDENADKAELDELSDISTHLGVLTLSKHTLLKMFFAILSITTFYLLTYRESILLSAPMTTYYDAFVYFSKHKEMVDFLFIDWGTVRIAQNPLGYITAILLILLGTIWIVKTIINKEERRILKQFISGFLIFNGIFLFIISIMEKSAYKDASKYVMNATLADQYSTTFNMEVAFLSFLLIAVILVAVEISRTKYKHVNFEVSWIIIGLAFLIAASISAILSMEFVFNYLINPSIYLDPTKYLAKFLTASILTSFAKVILVVSFLNGMIKFHKKKSSKLFSSGFQLLGIVYFITLAGEQVLRYLYSFLFPIQGVDYDVEADYILQRIINIEMVTAINFTLFWILLIVGFFSVTKTIIYDFIPPPPDKVKIKKEKKIKKKEIKKRAKKLK